MCPPVEGSGPLSSYPFLTRQHPFGARVETTAGSSEGAEHLGGAEYTHCAGRCDAVRSLSRCNPVAIASASGSPMHIPDGYLSPQTCAVMYGAAVPFWIGGRARVRKVVKSRYVPLLALGAGVQLPGDDVQRADPRRHDRPRRRRRCSSRSLLGPWAAVIAVSIALLIQALFFGDGGVLAFGANAFNMAFVMPFVGYGVYRALAAQRVAHRRRGGASPPGVGGYVGLNAAALCAAIEFGVQPELFFNSANGTPALRAVPSRRRRSRRWLSRTSRRRRRRVRADRRRRRVPAARQPAAPADQPRRRRRDRRRARRRRRARLALGARDRARRDARARRRSACSRRAARSARTRPANLDLGKYHLRAVPSGLRAATAASGATRCSTATASSTTSTRRSGTSSSAVVGIAADRGALVVVRLHGSSALARPRPRRRHRTRAAMTARPRTRRLATPTGSLQPEVGLCPCGCIGKRRKGSFVEKTLGGASDVLRQAMFSEDVAAQPGLLQRLDPRVKLVGAARPARRRRVRAARSRCSLAHVRGHARARARVAALAVGSSSSGCGCSSRSSPASSCCPATLNFITPGHDRRAARHLVRPPGRAHRRGPDVGGPDRDARGHVDLARRAAHAHHAVDAAARRAARAAACPRMFILVLSAWPTATSSTCSTSVTDMYTARKARTVGDVGATSRSGRRFVAASAGALFGKAHALSEEVHMAMVAAGVHRRRPHARPRPAFARSTSAWSRCGVLVVRVLASLWS